MMPPHLTLWQYWFHLVAFLVKIRIALINVTETKGRKKSCRKKASGVPIS